MRVEQSERLAMAAAEHAQAARAPSPWQNFAISVVSTACAIVLGGVVLMVVADVVNLVEPIDLWPLVSLGIVIVAIAGVSLAVGRDRGVDDVVRTLTAPWETERRFDALEQKVDVLLDRVQDARSRPSSGGGSGPSQS